MILGKASSPLVGLEDEAPEEVLLGIHGVHRHAVVAGGFPDPNQGIQHVREGAQCVQQHTAEFKPGITRDNGGKIQDRRHLTSSLPLK